MFERFLYIGVLSTHFMEAIDLEKIQVIMDMFVDKTSGLNIPNTIPSIRTKLTGPLAKLTNVSGIILELYNLGILTSDSHVVLDTRTFYITPKGVSILKLRGGIKKFYKDQAAKESLELEILKQTNQSYKLNTIQFIITTILALGTLGSL